MVGETTDPGREALGVVEQDDVGHTRHRSAGCGCPGAFRTHVAFPTLLVDLTGHKHLTEARDHLVRPDVETVLDLMG